MSDEPHGTGTIGRPTVVLVGPEGPARQRAETIVAEAPDLDLVGMSAGDDALAPVLALLPDLVLVDLGAGTGDPVALCAALYEQAPVVRVVVRLDDDDDRGYAAALAGACGAVVGDDGQLLAVLRRAATAGGVLTPLWARRVLADLDRLAEDPGELVVPVPPVTPTEREVLRRLGGGATAAEIGALHEVPARVVDVHAANALAKLRRMHRDQREVSALR